MDAWLWLAGIGCGAGLLLLLGICWAACALSGQMDEHREDWG